MRTSLFVWIITMLLTAGVEAQEEQGSDTVIHEAFPEYVPVEVGEPPQEAPTPISFAFDDVFREGRNVHEPVPLTAEDIAAADREFKESSCNELPGPARLGLVRRIEPVPISIDDGLAIRTELPDERTMWTFAMRSAGAYGMRVHFTNFNAGSASVVVYAEDDGGLIARGPYREGGPNRTGDFWTPSLPGDTVLVEVTGTEMPQLRLPEICHFDHDPAGTGPDEADPRSSGRALPCHLDVMCYPWIPDAARDATGKMNVICGDFASGCTGTLLVDLDAETSVPYFLTAYHCLSTQAQVDTMEVVWLWQNDACDATPPSSSDYYALPWNCGGTLLETNPTQGGNDMTFIRLAGDVPPGVSLAGWTTDAANPAIGIHHPGTGAGSWKRVTLLSGASCPECGVCGDHFRYDYFNIDAGFHEGGSSGSGVFNLSGQLAGQLFGGCCLSPDCADGVEECDEIGHWRAQYGEFEETYPIIRIWLEIGGTIHVDWANITPPFNGTPSDPFPSVHMAHAFAWDGARINVRSGSYPGALTLSKQLTVLAEGGAVVIGGP